MVWGDESDLTADDIVTRPGPEAKAAEVTSRAEAFLRRELAGGPVRVPDLIRRAEAEGVSRASLYRAKDGLPIRATREGFGGQSRWEISQPPHTETDETNETDGENQGHSRLSPETTGETDGEADETDGGVETDGADVICLNTPIRLTAETTTETDDETDGGVPEKQGDDAGLAPHSSHLSQRLRCPEPWDDEAAFAEAMTAYGTDWAGVLAWLNEAVVAGDPYPPDRTFFDVIAAHRKAAWVALTTQANPEPEASR